MPYETPRDPGENPHIKIRTAVDEDIAAITLLWEACDLVRPWNDVLTDIAFARRNPNATVLVLLADDRLVASLMVGHDGHRGAVYYVAVDPSAREDGYGRMIMEAAEIWLVMRGIWKLNLQVRKSNLGVIGFYKALGYDEEETVSLSKALQPMPHIDRA